MKPANGVGTAGFFIACSPVYSVISEKLSISMDFRVDNDTFIEADAIHSNFLSCEQVREAPFLIFNY